MKNLQLALFFILFAPIYMQAQFSSSLVLKHQTISYNHSNLEFAFLNKPNNKSFSELWSTPRPKYTFKNLTLSSQNNNNMFSNRRLKYSSLWTFVSLNYLYADLVGLMDANLLIQYQTGVVNRVEITPAFLTVAAAYMQLPLSNVFLPQVIKNDKTLRWIQIISGSIATLAQGATLFVGKPTPYYLLFSAIEMGATTFITIDALKWKTGKKKR